MIEIWRCRFFRKLALRVRQIALAFLIFTVWRGYERRRILFINFVLHLEFEAARISTATLFAEHNHTVYG